MEEVRVSQTQNKNKNSKKNKGKEKERRKDKFTEIQGDSMRREFIQKKGSKLLFPCFSNLSALQLPQHHGIAKCALVIDFRIPVNEVMSCGYCVLNTEPPDVLFV